MNQTGITKGNILDFLAVATSTRLVASSSFTDDPCRRTSLALRIAWCVAVDISVIHLASEPLAQTACTAVAVLIDLNWFVAHPADARMSTHAVRIQHTGEQKKNSQ